MGRSEVERRRDYIELLEKELHDGDDHLLTQIVKQCLQNVPSRQPTTEQLVTELQQVRATTEGPCGAADAPAAKATSTFKANHKGHIIRTTH